MLSQQMTRIIEWTQTGGKTHRVVVTEHHNETRPAWVDLMVIAVNKLNLTDIMKEKNESGPFLSETISWL